MDSYYEFSKANCASSSFFKRTILTLASKRNPPVPLVERFYECTPSIQGAVLTAIGVASGNAALAQARSISLGARCRSSLVLRARGDRSRCAPQPTGFGYGGDRGSVRTAWKVRHCLAANVFATTENSVSVVVAQAVQQGRDRRLRRRRHSRRSLRDWARTAARGEDQTR